MYSKTLHRHRLIPLMLILLNLLAGWTPQELIYTTDGVIE